MLATKVRKLASSLGGSWSLYKISNPSRNFGMVGLLLLAMRILGWEKHNAMSESTNGTCMCQVGAVLLLPLDVAVCRIPGCGEGCCRRQWKIWRRSSRNPRNSQAPVGRWPLNSSHVSRTEMALKSISKIVD